MNEEEFAAQEASLGARVHSSDGVWWSESPRLMCKPVYEFKEIQPGAARPAWRRSALGYVHFVPADEKGNSTAEYMVLGGDALQGFRIEALKPRKRSLIRKAAGVLAVQPLTDLERDFPEMLKIAISAAQRIGRGHGWRYYAENGEKWHETLKALFALPRREWWGVYLENRLVAYSHSYLVDDTMNISAAKSHSDFLGYNPNDALLYRFVTHCQSVEGCRRIVFGGWTVPESQNYFKEQYGFRRTAIPAYVSNPRLRGVFRIVLKGAKRVRQRLLQEGGRHEDDRANGERAGEERSA